MVQTKHDLKDASQGFRVFVLTHPFSDQTGQTILANFIDYLVPICDDIYVASGDFTYVSDKVHIFKNCSIKIDNFMPLWIYKQIKNQISNACYLLINSNKFSIAVFFLGGRVQLLPLIMAKLLRKKTIVTATGSSSGTTKGVYSKRILGKLGIISYLAQLFEFSCFSLCDQVAVESPSAISFLKLNRYSEKIVINGAMYIDTSLFTVLKPISERKNIVGFIGRLSREKGILNFIEAIPLILKQRNDVEFLICGDGTLQSVINTKIKASECEDNVHLVGWVSHNNLPHYLNEIKLLVLPSYSEGVPGVVQEAMACGTPVLATLVGGIPDLIKDGLTGFSLGSNSPGEIALGVLRALDNVYLPNISRNSVNLIQENYTIDKMILKCYNSFSELSPTKAGLLDN